MSAVERLMVPGLRHAHAGMDDEEFFSAIEQAGGWPTGYTHVGFEHTLERAAGFTNWPGSSGWWTVVASADDFYLWKLSPEALQRIADAVIKASGLYRVNASNLHIKNSRGYRAAIAKLTGGGN